MLSITDHRRDSAGLRYIYPVISRRAGGVSIGINLNVNNACNWRCVYCQVENLTRGGPPPVDIALLEKELRHFLQDALHGDFMVRSVPESARQLVDIAFSGNGEPTSASEFPEVVEIVGRLLDEFELKRRLPVRLITNGSLIYRESVQQGLKTLATLAGEVWFKLDRADPAGMVAINDTAQDPLRVRNNLALCVDLVPTWIQTCWFALDGEAPDEAVINAYCDLLQPLAEKIAGIHLYGLARPSMQPDAGRLTRLSKEALGEFAVVIQRKTGIRVNVSP